MPNAINGLNPADLAIAAQRLRNDQDRVDRAAAHARGGAPEDDRLKTVCNEFAGQFLGMVYKTMGGEKQWSDLGHGGTAETIFQEMTYDRYAGNAARSGAGGLGELLYKSLARRTHLAAAPKR